MKKTFLFAVLLLTLGLTLGLGCRAPQPGYEQPGPNQQSNQPTGQPAGPNTNATPDPAGNQPVGNTPAPMGNDPATGPTASTTPLIPPPLPRVLVYMQGEKGDELNSEVEQIFIDGGFKLIDRNQLQNIKEVDAALSTNDKNKFLALKHRYGIEVIVTAKVKWDFIARRRIYGRSQDSFKGSISMKGIEADSAEIIYSKSSRTNESGSDRVLVRAAKNLANLFAEKLKQHWAKKKYQGRELDVVISQVQYEHLSTLERYLGQIPQVTSKARRSYTKETAFYNIGFRGDASGLEKILMNCPYLTFDIVRTTDNRIELVFKGSKAQMPPDRNPEPDTGKNPEPDTGKNPEPDTGKTPEPVTPPKTPETPAAKDQPGFSPPEEVGASGSSDAVWTIVNESDYAVHLSYTGSANGSATIEPRSTATLTFKGGTYLIKAASTKPNVIPYYGNHALEAGKKYQNKFHIKKKDF